MCISARAACATWSRWRRPGRRLPPPRHMTKTVTDSGWEYALPARFACPRGGHPGPWREDGSGSDGVDAAVGAVVSALGAADGRMVSGRDSGALSGRGESRQACADGLRRHRDTRRFGDDRRTLASLSLGSVVAARRRPHHRCGADVRPRYARSVVDHIARASSATRHPTMEAGKVVRDQRDAV